MNEMYFDFFEPNITCVMQLEKWNQRNVIQINYSKLSGQQHVIYRSSLGDLRGIKFHFKDFIHWLKLNAKYFKRSVKIKKSIC